MFIVSAKVNRKKAAACALVLGGVLIGIFLLARGLGQSPSPGEELVTAATDAARAGYLEQLGWGYDKLEKMGIVSPVLSVNCNYKQSTTFPDKVEITVAMKEFNGLRFKLAYEMRKLPEQTVVCTAVSEHAFLDEAFKPLRLKKEHPDFYKAMEDAVK